MPLGGQYCPKLNSTQTNQIRKQAKDQNKHFSKDIKMAKKYVKKHPASFSG
jgi:hypothetical protein